MKDTEVSELIKRESKRQGNVYNLIASENSVSKDVLLALGSKFTNKYAEGYPGRRYYGGNKIIDELEKLCQQRALDLFCLDPKEWSVNVQALSGSPANLAVYSALLPKDGKILGMALSSGGHLTHGQPVSMTGKFWKSEQYTVNEDGLLDYSQIQQQAEQFKPDILVAGYTAYSRDISYDDFKTIVDGIHISTELGRPYLLTDISHTAGLVAAGEFTSPFEFADIVTMTTHKTLRGPRAALIFSRNTQIGAKNNGDPIFISDLIDKAIFPGLQGGPHMNTIAAVAVALKEASTPEFKKYAKQVIKNAQAMAETFTALGYKVISGGTDSHLFVVDVWNNGTGISGGDASKILETKNIIVNKNTIPGETRSPFDPSGLRIGTAAITTQRKFTTDDCRKLVYRIHYILSKSNKK